MLRKILALLAGLVVWLLLASIVNRLLRLAIADYAAAEPAMRFTLTMLWARLAMGVLASLAAGYAAARLAPGSARLPALLGGLLLLFFLPVHYHVWSNFPAWYHLLFLGTLMPLVMLGARLARPAASRVLTAA